jgi:hypothetical protein
MFPTDGSTNIDGVHLVVVPNQVFARSHDRIALDLSVETEHSRINTVVEAIVQQSVRLSQDLPEETCAKEALNPVCAANECSVVEAIEAELRNVGAYCCADASNSTVCVPCDDKQLMGTLFSRRAAWQGAFGQPEADDFTLDRIARCWPDAFQMIADCIIERRRYSRPSHERSPIVSRRDPARLSAYHVAAGNQQNSWQMDG